MALTDEQIRLLFGSNTHFPARFPELARIDIVPIDLPPLTASGQQKSKQSILALEITEVQRGFLQRLVPLSEVRSIFLPNDVDPKSLSLDNGAWLFGPQIPLEDGQRARRALGIIKDRVAEGNPQGLGIAFVAETARILNLVSIAAQADECGFLFDRLGHDKRSCC